MTERQELADGMLICDRCIVFAVYEFYADVRIPLRLHLSCMVDRPTRPPPPGFIVSSAAEWIGRWLSTMASRN